MIHFKHIVIMGLYFAMIAAIFWMATFLMYHKIDGWGWLIAGAIFIAGAMKVSIKDR